MNSQFFLHIYEEGNSSEVTLSGAELGQLTVSSFLSICLLSLDKDNRNLQVAKVHSNEGMKI